MAVVATKSDGDTLYADEFNAVLDRIQNAVDYVKTKYALAHAPTGFTGNLFEGKVGANLKYAVDEAGNLTIAGVAYVWPTADGTAGYFLKTDGAGNLSWAAASSGGAPTGATYVVVSADATLTAERVLVAGTGLTATDGGAGGNLTLAWNGVTVEKAGVVVGTRPAINFIEGTNVTLTIADDSAGGEVDVTIAASGSGAPTDATYVTLTTHASLSAERTLAAGTGLTLTDGGAGLNATLAFDTTWGDARYATLSGATFAGNVILNNNIKVQGKDTGGTVYTLIQMGSDNVVYSGTSTYPYSLWGSFFKFNGKVELATGVEVNGGGMKHARISTGSIPASGHASVAWTYTTAFADGNYTVMGEIMFNTTDTSHVEMQRMKWHSNTGMEFYVENNDSASQTASMHAIAVHD